MLKKNFSKKAQSTLEYAILIAVIVGALIAMQVYLKRGYQGKLRDSADDLGDQFSPGNTTYNYNITNSSRSTEDFTGGVTTTTIKEQTSNKTGSETVADFTQEYWWQ